MSKIIKINTDYLKQEKKRGRTRKKKPDFNKMIRPNDVKKALIQRIKQHQQQKSQEEYQKLSEEKPLETSSSFGSDLHSSLQYLNSIVEHKEHKKKARKEKKRKQKNIITTNITKNDDPPYGILKGGKKPLYSEYKRTLKNKYSTPIIIHNKSPPKPLTPSLPPLPRKKKLKTIQNKIRKTKIRKDVIHWGKKIARLEF